MAAFYFVSHHRPFPIKAVNGSFYTRAALLLITNLILPIGMYSLGSGTSPEAEMWGRPRSCQARTQSPRPAVNRVPVFPVAGGSSGHGHPVCAGYPAAGSVQGTDRHR